jgi:hypothetical protein
MKSSSLMGAMLLGLAMGSPVQGRGSKQYLAPATGPGSGRIAKCKHCGAEGLVTHGADGRRRIEGCTC